MRPHSLSVQSVRAGGMGDGECGIGGTGECGGSLPRLTLCGPNFLLRQPELSFGGGGVTKLASAITDPGLSSVHGANSLMNFIEFLLKYSSAFL
jgi:hypothetical protein